MNQLGDLLFSLPALKAARQETDAQIYSVIKPAFLPLLETCGLIDGSINKDQSILKLIKEIRQNNFTSALLFSESPSSLLSAYFSKINERIGFETASFNFLLTKKVQKTGVPSIENNNRLCASFGLKNISSDYVNILKIPNKNFDNVYKWFESVRINPKKTIALSPGSSKKRKSKQLHDDIWVYVMDKISERDFDFVLFGAPDERESLERLAAKCRKKPQIFTAPNGILDAAAFLKSCGLYLGIDSGAMHLSAAVGTKCAAVFVNTDPLQIGPRPLEKHIVITSRDGLITPQEIISKIL
jgi:ADP-heptose:LPS heptosyltransferase